MPPEQGDGPFFESSEVALVIGFAALIVAAWCFRDAYEKRGRDRPLLVKLAAV